MLSRLSQSFCRSLSSAPKIISVVNENRIVTVKWEDGKVGQFPVIWLRDTSADEKTYSVGPAMKARNLTMNTFDVRQSPISVNLVNNQELVLEWPEDVHSRFTSEWLRQRNPSCPEARKRRREVYLFPTKTWGREEMANGPKKFDHQKVLNDDKECHDFLEAVCLDGVAVVKGGPRGKRGAVEDIGERIGLIHNTHFGKVFEVAKKPDASNMAYASSGGLPFHTDFPSLSHPPQLQMLHMLTKAVEGGNSLFVDGFHVAEQLRVERPEVFEILSKYSMEFIEEGFDIHDGPDGKLKNFTFDMCARHRVIKLDETGKVIKIQFGNAMRSWFYDCEPRKIQEIYDAMKVFTDYCYQERNVLKFALEEGDTVLWANTRLLHTRDAYRDTPSQIRTLTGCYFAWDMVKSRVRVLRDNLQLSQNQPSI